jgi:hypothetical protein
MMGTLGLDAMTMRVPQWEAAMLLTVNNYIKVRL